MKSYLKLIENPKNSNINDELLIDLYITLISLNSNSYSEKEQKKESEKIKLLLTKLNNLKVKIQLNRKPKEIDELIKIINDCYEEESDLYYRYIKDQEEFLNILNSKDTIKLTSYIDRITKKEIEKEDNVSISNEEREIIINNIFNGYTVKDNIITISNKEYQKERLLDIFDYLLVINNYPSIYKSVSSNTSRKELIQAIIKSIKNKFTDESFLKVLIPTLLIQLLPNISNNSNTDSFVIENIKIKDLYSLKENTNNINSKNIKVPNEYLFTKIKEIMENGMFYYKDNKFIMELVKNKVSDFKVSIDILELKEFIMNNMRGE